MTNLYTNLLSFPTNLGNPKLKIFFTKKLTRTQFKVFPLKNFFNPFYKREKNFFNPSLCRCKTRIRNKWSCVSHTCSWLPCPPSIPFLFHLPKIPPGCVLRSNPRKCYCPYSMLVSYCASHCQLFYAWYQVNLWYFLAATYRLAGNDGIIYGSDSESRGKLLVWPK